MIYFFHSNQSMNDGHERFDIDYVLLYSTMNVKMGSSGSFIVDDFRLRFVRAPNELQVGR